MQHIFLLVSVIREEWSYKMSVSKSFKCDICNQSYVWTKSIIRHLNETHNLDKNYRSLNSEKYNIPTLSPGIPDEEFRKLLEKESLNEPQDEPISKNRFVFKHPFSMIV